MQAVPVAATFEQAERLRIDGKFASAARVYREVISMIDESHELWVPANHMLAVTLKSLAQPGTAEITEAENLLHKLISSDLVEDPAVLANLKRDHADVFRKIGIYQRGRDLAQESFEELMKLGADHCDAAAASLGFMARAEFVLGNFQTARILAEAADEMFSGEDQMWLYNLVWLIRYYAHLGDEDELRSAIGDAHRGFAAGLGNETHRTTVNIINDHWRDPVEMELKLDSFKCF